MVENAKKVIPWLCYPNMLIDHVVTWATNAKHNYTKAKVKGDLPGLSLSLSLSPFLKAAPRASESWFFVVILFYCTS